MNYLNMENFLFDETIIKIFKLKRKINKNNKYFY